jgi:hypothetical protein
MSGARHPNRHLRWSAAVAEIIILYQGPIVTRDEARSKGLLRFFTGIPCPHGHIDERYVSCNRCVECALISANKTYHENHDREVERRRDYYYRITKGRRRILSPRLYTGDITIYYSGPIISRVDAETLGLRHYFTGEHCARGHIAQRTVKRGSCIICKREQVKEYQKRHPEKVAEFAQRRKDSGSAAESSRRYYQSKANRPKINARRRKRNADDPLTRIRNCLRARLSAALKSSNLKKSLATYELIGCSIPDLINHIERQFASKMKWENYGKIWHIDHIIPVASFDLSKEEEQRACFHFTNLRPMLKKPNHSKGGKRTLLL